VIGAFMVMLTGLLVPLYEPCGAGQPLKA